MMEPGAWTTFIQRWNLPPDVLNNILQILLIEEIRSQYEFGCTMSSDKPSVGLIEEISSENGCHPGRLSLDHWEFRRRRNLKCGDRHMRLNPSFSGYSEDIYNPTYFISGIPIRFWKFGERMGIKIQPTDWRQYKPVGGLKDSKTFYKNSEQRRWHTAIGDWPRFLMDKEEELIINET